MRSVNRAARRKAIAWLAGDGRVKLEICWNRRVRSFKQTDMTKGGSTTVMVSGCFDLLHSGHIAFFEEAAELGRLIVCIGSDKTVLDLKGRAPVNSEQERLYVVSSLRCVSEACVSSGGGMLDFLPELERIGPDLFFVNADGDSELKRNAIESRGIKYVVAQRRPKGDLVARSTTALRLVDTVPYRLDLAGGWLDQPFVSKHAAGPVVNCSLEPDQEYELRSGMASSTRRTAVHLWGPRLPSQDREKLARMIFAFENPPGTVDVAGSQDAIGIVYPGVTRMDYTGAYWPQEITSCLEPEVLSFLEAHLQLVFSAPRPKEFAVLAETRVNPDSAKRLSDAAHACWEKLLARDAIGFGKAMTSSFNAQLEMFPLMTNPGIQDIIRRHEGRSMGHKITGAGGGGYVVFFSERPIEGAKRVRIRVES
jgi:cytidyltransferase-like protein